MRSYANEAEYHQWFINHIHQVNLLNRAVPILVIGHELSLFGGSRSGGSGSADLLAIDGECQVWLIEAKMASSAEFGTVWAQLARYRDSLQAHNRWDVLERQMLKFLSGREICQPATPRYRGYASLHAVLADWLTGLSGKERHADAFASATAEQLRTGTLGLAVLADIPPPRQVCGVADALSHGGPKAWITSHPCQGARRHEPTITEAPGYSIFRRLIETLSTIRPTHAVGSTH